jgi:hypothetical protein
MSRPPADQPAAQPDRLLASDATDFERRVLEAALQKKPPQASSARMARALGVTVATIGTATTATTAAAGAAVVSKATAAGATVLWPWISVGVLGLVVAGAVVGTRASRDAGERRPPAPAVVAPAPPPPAPSIQPAVVTETQPAPVAPSPRSRATAAVALREQVALIDSARAALSEGESRRVLEILRRYQDKYPAGTFRPEATAIRIEALMKLGRETEARALAARFVAEHRGSLLARRVADVAGLTEP